jgi:hypothetical protein
MAPEQPIATRTPNGTCNCLITVEIIKDQLGTESSTLAVLTTFSEEPNTKTFLGSIYLDLTDTQTGSTKNFMFKQK